MLQLNKQFQSITKSCFIGLKIIIFTLFFYWLLLCFSSIGLHRKSLVGNNIQSLWSVTPSINHTNYPIPCNIYDNAANDALIASISQVFWWSDTQIRKKQVSSCGCSHSIHHHLAFVYDKCYIYFSCLYFSSPAHVESGFFIGSLETRQLLLFKTIIFHWNFVYPVKLYTSAKKKKNYSVKA